MTPEKLVRGLRASDPRAAALVWERYAPMVRRVLRRALGPESDEADCMHGAFVALLETIDRLETPASLESYLYGIALNTARRELARRRRWRLFHRAQLPEERVPPKQSGLDARRAVTELYRILDELSPKLRLAFVLRYFEGLELTEVAATLGYSLASTKRYLKKARSLVLARASTSPRLAEYITHSARR